MFSTPPCGKLDYLNKLGPINFNLAITFAPVYNIRRLNLTKFARFH